MFIFTQVIAGQKAAGPVSAGGGGRGESSAAESGKRFERIPSVRRFSLLPELPA